MKRIVHLLILVPLIAHAQWVDDYYQSPVQPRLYLGGDAAAFRISLTDFDDLYDGRWGGSYGAFVGVRAFGSHYIMARYGRFDKNGTQGVHPETGSELADARWQEQWLKLGLRIHPQPTNKWGSYYGFGFGFFDINEKEPLSIFDFQGQQRDSNDGTGSGFYLEFGIDYFVLEKAAAFFDIEISSGGTRGRSSFEAMSVGGWRFSTGITLWPF